MVRCPTFSRSGEGVHRPRRQSCFATNHIHFWLHLLCSIAFHGQRGLTSARCAIFVCVTYTSQNNREGDFGFGIFHLILPESRCGSQPRHLFVNNGVKLDAKFTETAFSHALRCRISIPTYVEWKGALKDGTIHAWKTSWGRRMMQDDTGKNGMISAFPKWCRCIWLRKLQGVMKYSVHIWHRRRGLCYGNFRATSSWYVYYMRRCRRMWRGTWTNATAKYVEALNRRRVICHGMC